MYAFFHFIFSQRARRLIYTTSTIFLSMQHLADGEEQEGMRRGGGGARSGKVTLMRNSRHCNENMQQCHYHGNHGGQHHSWPFKVVSVSSDSIIDSGAKTALKISCSQSIHLKGIFNYSCNVTQKVLNESKHVFGNLLLLLV